MAIATAKWDFVIVDEAQFLSENQVNELAKIADECGINVICYGLRTDFQTHLFPGSKRLFEIADTFEEIKSQCEDGEKNIFNARIDQNGEIVTDGEQVQVGAEDCYKSVSRKEYSRMLSKKQFKEWQAMFGMHVPQVGSEIKSEITEKG